MVYQRIWKGAFSTLFLAGAVMTVQAQEKKEIIIKQIGSDKKETVIVLDKKMVEGEPLSPPSHFNVFVPQDIEAGLVTGMPLGQGGGPTFSMAHETMPFESKVVKSLPYSADAVSEFTQTLPDGNRIQRKSESQIYRDSEGRTRREFSPLMIGMVPGLPDLGKSIQIVDPVAGVTLLVDPKARTVTKMNMPPVLTFDGAPTGAASTGVMITKIEKAEVKMSTNVESQNGVTRIITRRLDGPGAAITEDVKEIKIGNPGQLTVIAEAGKNIRTEKLGKQMVEGIEAEGTRTVETIPAGQVGNEKAIEIVNERWYSNELQLVILTRHSDPRFGESVYRVINLSRNEPDAALFAAPADYKVTEGFSMSRKIEIRK